MMLTVVIFSQLKRKFNHKLFAEFRYCAKPIKTNLLPINMSRPSKCLLLVLFVATTILTTTARPRSHNHWRSLVVNKNPISSRRSFCGETAQTFLRDLCNDETFQLPYKSYEVPNILTKFSMIISKKVEDPFWYKAALCCVNTCNHSDFKELCKFHKKSRNEQA